MARKNVIIDGIKWYAKPVGVQPICIKHHLRMRPVDFAGNRALASRTNLLNCEDCVKVMKLPRKVDAEETYVMDRIDAQQFKKIKYINLDDEAIPIAEDKARTEDGKYFVKAILTESKVGQRLVVYAGERGSKEKAQIFIEPDIKRLAFDQTDTHPTEVFTRLEATFQDGTKSAMETNG